MAEETKNPYAVDLGETASLEEAYKDFPERELKIRENVARGMAEYAMGIKTYAEVVLSCTSQVDNALDAFTVAGYLNVGLSKMSEYNSIENQLLRLAKQK